MAATLDWPTAPSSSSAASSSFLQSYLAMAAHMLPLPEALAPWLAVNTTFHVLLCCRPECQHAVSPSAAARHLRDKHQVSTELQKLAAVYSKQWQWPYNFQSVLLPLEMSLP